MKYPECGVETNTGNELINCVLRVAHKGPHEAMNRGSNYRWSDFSPRYDDAKCPSEFGAPSGIASCQKMAFHPGPHRGATDDLSFAHEWVNESDFKPKAQGGLIKEDPINPPHYKAHPSGVECITVTEHMSFCLGNAVKHLWRAGEKASATEDLKKAIWYIQREITRLATGADS